VVDRAHADPWRHGHDQTCRSKRCIARCRIIRRVGRDRRGATHGDRARDPGNQPQMTEPPAGPLSGKRSSVRPEPGRALLAGQIRLPRRRCVKVERPEWATMRASGAPPLPRGDALAASRSTAARRSRSPGARDSADREALIERIGLADIFHPTPSADVPGSSASTGRLSPAFRDLIYADLGAFGHLGPWKEGRATSRSSRRWRVDLADEPIPQARRPAIGAPSSTVNRHF